MKQFLRNWWLTATATAIILWLTLAPHPIPENNLPLFHDADKLVHALMMATLTVTAMHDLSKSRKESTKKMTAGTFATVIICIVVFSALDEYAQSTMGIGRSGDIYDFLADLGGIITAGCGTFLIFSRKNR
ncbi:MAG: VanZ family protein [Candidatus Amulumruptor caecigallinarius]|nr:VanZ family protein [Candidatus Amulumruptor caecigallinarius]